MRISDWSSDVCSSDLAPVHGLLHPEIGHVRVRRAPGDNFPGICSFHGDCVEGLTSGPALMARFGTAANKVAPNDPRWLPVAKELAELTAMLLLTVSPRRLLIGGGVGMGQSHLFPMIRAHCAAIGRPSCRERVGHSV